LVHTAVISKNNPNSQVMINCQSQALFNIVILLL